MLIVKPAMSLDIIAKVRKVFPDYPLFAYQVSRDYLSNCDAMQIDKYCI